MDQLRTDAREALTRMFATVLPDVASGMVDLAKGAEKEDVRFRASKWILEEFADRGAKPQSLPGTNVTIVNAIPFERTAYIDKKPAQTVDVGNLTVALPKPVRAIGPEPETHSTKRSFVGTKQQEPSEVKVPVLPPRDGSKR